MDGRTVAGSPGPFSGELHVFAVQLTVSSGSHVKLSWPRTHFASSASSVLETPKSVSRDEPLMVLESKLSGAEPFEAQPVDRHVSTRRFVWLKAKSQRCISAAPPFSTMSPSGESLGAVGAKLIQNWVFGQPVLDESMPSRV